MRKIDSSFPQSFAVHLLLVLWLAAVASVPAAATPTLSPPEMYQGWLASGQVEAGREGLRAELARLYEALDASVNNADLSELGERALTVNDLVWTLRLWANGEARGAHDGKITVADSLEILERELLPGAEKAASLRRDLEARLGKRTIAPDEALEQSWIFDAIRWREAERDRLPLALARLARLSASPRHVEEVFAAFGGRLGEHASASAYLTTPEKYEKSLALSGELSGEIGGELKELALPTPPAGASELIDRFYQALVDKDGAEIRSCLAATSVQEEAILAGLDRRQVVAIAPVTEMTLSLEDSGAWKAVVEAIDITFIDNGEEVTRQGSQTFLLEFEAATWKILEVRK